MKVETSIDVDFTEIEELTEEELANPEVQELLRKLDALINQ